MTTILLMTLTCLATWLAVALIAPRDLAVAVGAGMAGPLVAAIASWWAVERAARIDVARVSPVLMQAFAAKMAFFAAYVVVVVRVLAVPVAPFAMAFAVYFLALLATEATLVRRLTN